MTQRQAFIAIHITAVLFGLTGILGELIQASALLITAGRASFAVLTLSLTLRYQGLGISQGLHKRHYPALLLAAIMLAIHWATFFYAVKVGGVAIATLGFASFPAFITLGEWALKDRIRRFEWTVLGLVTLGLILVTPSFNFADQATIGLAWAVLSGFTFALFTLINRKAATQLPAQQVAWWENLFVALLSWPFAWGVIDQAGYIDWFWIALLGVFCTALSHFLLVASLSVLNARSAGIVIALEPVYAIAFAALLFAQYPSLRMIVGGSIMVGAICWAGLRAQTRPST